MKVYGKNTFNELINQPNKIKKITLSKNFNDHEIMKLIKENNLKYEFLESKALDRLVDGNHQGIIINIDDFEYTEVESMYNDNLVVMLDHLEDPHNFGAIIRTCEAAGIKSIIIPKDRSVSVNSTVMKTSSGALNNINIATVNNINHTIKDFKNNGFFVYAADMDGRNYQQTNFADKVLLIIGNEGKGVSRLVRENSDEIISIPMYGNINSLNASVAAAIIIYGIVNK